MITAIPLETAVIVVPFTETTLSSDDEYVIDVAFLTSSSLTIRLKPLSEIIFPPLALIVWFLFTVTVFGFTISLVPPSEVGTVTDN